MSRSAEAHQTAIETLVDDDKIRLRVEPELENYFDVYGFGCDGEPSTPEHPSESDQATIDMIELDGLWIVLSEYRCPQCGQWEVADSIGMITANDPTDQDQNPYVDDLLDAAMCQYQAAH